MNASREQPQLIGRDGGSLSDYVPLAALAASLPRRRAGRKTSVATIYRWTSNGCRGVKLRYIQVGATRCSTMEWVNDFFEALTEAPLSRSQAAQVSGDVPATSSPVRTSAARLRAHEAAERELSKLGV